MYRKPYDVHGEAESDLNKTVNDVGKDTISSATKLTVLFFKIR